MTETGEDNEDDASSSHLTVRIIHPIRKERALPPACLSEVALVGPTSDIHKTGTGNPTVTTMSTSFPSIAIGGCNFLDGTLKVSMGRRTLTAASL